MLNIVWEFHARPERNAEFERIYESNGRWAQLFSVSAAYHGTALVRDLNDPCRYLCIDRWDNMDEFQSFKQSNKEDYAALDKMCEDLTVKETLIGYFQTL